MHVCTVGDHEEADEIPSIKQDVASLTSKEDEDALPDVF